MVRVGGRRKPTRLPRTRSGQGESRGTQDGVCVYVGCRCVVHVCVYAWVLCACVCGGCTCVHVCVFVCGCVSMGRVQEGSV